MDRLSPFTLVLALGNPFGPVSSGILDQPLEKVLNVSTLTEYPQTSSLWTTLGSRVDEDW